MANDLISSPFTCRCTTHLGNANCVRLFKRSIPRHEHTRAKSFPKFIDLLPKANFLFIRQQEKDIELRIVRRGIDHFSRQHILGDKLPWNTLNVNPSGPTWMLPKEWYCSCCSRMFRTSSSSVNVEPMSKVTCDVKLSDVGLKQAGKLLAFFECHWTEPPVTQWLRWFLYF